MLAFGFEELRLAAGAAEQPSSLRLLEPSRIADRQRSRKLKETRLQVTHSRRSGALLVDVPEANDFGTFMLQSAASDLCCRQAGQPARTSGAFQSLGGLKERRSPDEHGERKS
jgi:hypothetical protein